MAGVGIPMIQGVISSLHASALYSGSGHVSASSGTGAARNQTAAQQLKFRIRAAARVCRAGHLCPRGCTHVRPLVACCSARVFSASRCLDWRTVSCTAPASVVVGQRFFEQGEEQHLQQRAHFERAAGIGQGRAASGPRKPPQPLERD